MNRASITRKQNAIAAQKWRAKNPDYWKEYYNKRKLEISDRMKAYYLEKKEYINDRNNEWIKANPWYVSFRNAKNRCLNPNDPAYEDYGGRGIKFLMTLDDFKFLWFRDKAYNMEVPTVDRLDSNSNYQVDNCEYVELQENGFRAQMKLNKERMN